MRKLLLLLSFFILTSVYADETPTGGNKVLRNWQKHLANQQAYDYRTKKAASEQIASVSMGPEGSSQRAQVKQLLERSGVLEDGSKAKIGASVTKPADTAKVASTLVDRLKNAKTYAKNLGKASIPSFVGMAAFTGLMEGIDWVMDEGGKVNKQFDINNAPSCFADGSNCKFSQNLYYYRNSAVYPSASSLCSSLGSGWKQGHSGYEHGCFTANDGWTGIVFTKTANPSYSASSPLPAGSEVSDSELQTALKNALESNNSALATAIADVIKSAYTQDNSEGQPNTINPLVADAQKDMQSAVDNAFDNPTTTAGTADRPEGYYKITDGEKTIEGYVKPSNTTSTGTTDSTTVTNPDGSTTTTGTTSTGWPGFCDWAGVVCDFIDWVKEEPENEEIELPEQELEKQEIKKDLIKASASSCPPDVRFDVSGLPFNITPKRPVEMQPICDTIEPLKYVFQLITFCFCAFMIVRL